MFTLLIAVASLIVGNPQPDGDRSIENNRDAIPTMQTTQNIKYVDRPDSPDYFTMLDVYQPTTRQPNGKETLRPILIYIHGGGWAFGDKSGVFEKPDWAFRNDWVLVSVNYRLSPRVAHPEHARDVAAAVAYIHTHATDFGGDPDRIVLIGHSAGAHLAAIVADEESLLGEFDLSPADLKGVVLLDGAAYNIPNQMKSPWLPEKIRAMLVQAFGTDPDVWIQASPTLQARLGDKLPSLLAVHIDRPRSTVESIELVDVWNETGSSATRHFAPDKDHAGLNHLMGRENDPDTQVVQAFIRSAFGQD